MCETLQTSIFWILILPPPSIFLDSISSATHCKFVSTRLHMHAQKKQNCKKSRRRGSGENNNRKVMTERTIEKILLGNESSKF